ncbi:MAG: phage tail tape measure protein [Chloroflexota bacterium]
MAGTSTDVDLVLSASLGQFVAGLNEATQRLTGALETMRTSAQKETSEIDAAFEKLGLKRFSDIEREVDEVKAAFERLKASGELTGAALVQAQVRMDEQVREIRAQTNGWADSLDKVKVQAIAAAASLAGVVRVLGNAGGAAADFGQKMAEVGTQLDETSGLPQLTEQVRELAREMGGDAVNNAQGLYDILSAGVSDPVAAMERLTQANKLAVGGVTDVTTAAGGLNAAMNAYGAAVGSAADVSDSFFVAAKQGATSVAELATNVGSVAPLASQAGVAFDELIASVTALTNGGVETSQAFTQVQSILTAVVKPTKEARDLAEELGIQFDVAAIKSQGLSGFLQDVSEKTGGSAEKMAVLFGRVEGLNGALALTGGQAESFARTLDAMAQKAGASEKAFQALSNTDAFKIQQFNAALKDAQLSLGNAVTALTPVLQGITALLNGFNELPGPIRTTIAGITALAAVVAPLALAWSTLKGPLTLLAATVLPQLGTALAATGAAATATAGGAAAMAARFGPIAALLGGVTIAAQLGADALTEYALAQQQAVADAAYAERLREEIAARQEQAKALQQYAEVAVLSAEQLAGLGEAERASYVQRLESAKAYASAVSGVLVRQRELEGATAANTAALKANRDRQDELNKGLAALSQGLRLAAETAKSGLSPAAQQLANDLRAAAGSSEDADKALKELFDGIKADAPAGEISRIVTALGDLAGGSDAVAMTLRDRLGVALRELSGTELAAFQSAAQAAMDAGRGSAEGLAAVLDSVVAESLRALGADAVTIGEAFTDAGQEAIGAFTAVANSGRASAQQVLAAFNLALAKLATPQEIEALLASLRKVGPAAGLSMGQMETAAADAAKALLKVKTAQGEVNEEVLRSQIRKLEDQYTALIKSGTATAEELGKVREQLRGLNKDLENLGNKGKDAGDKLKDAGGRGQEGFDRTADSAGKAGDAIKHAGDQTERAGEQTKGAERALRDLDASAQSVTISLGKMSEQFARAAMDAAGSARSAKEYMDTWNSWVREYGQQEKAFNQRLEAANRTIQALDEEERAMARLRDTFGAIADDELRKLIAAEERAQELRRKSTEETKQRTDAERELRKEIEQTNQSNSGSGGTVKRTVEVVLRVQNEQSGSAPALKLTEAQVREIADRVIAEIKRDQGL